MTFQLNADDEIGAKVRFNEKAARRGRKVATMVFFGEANRNDIGQGWERSINGGEVRKENMDIVEWR